MTDYKYNNWEDQYRKPNDLYVLCGVIWRVEPEGRMYTSRDKAHSTYSFDDHKVQNEVTLSLSLSLSGIHSLS